MVRALVCLLLAAVLSPAAEYTAKWSSSNSGAGGDIRIRLDPQPEVVFTFDGRDVKTTVVRLDKSDGGFEIAYDFSLEGYDLRSTLKARVAGEKIEGDYRTTPTGGSEVVDTGTFRGESKP